MDNNIILVRDIIWEAGCWYLGYTINLVTGKRLVRIKLIAHYGYKINTERIGLYTSRVSWDEHSSSMVELMVFGDQETTHT